MIGLVAGLLPQLPAGVDLEGLPRHVAQPCRELPQHGPHGVPVLTDEQHPVVVVESEHADRSRVPDEVTRHRSSSAEVDGLPQDVPDVPVEGHLVSQDGQVARYVAKLRRASRHEGSETTGCSTGSSSRVSA